MIRRLHRNGFVLLSAGPFNDLIYGEVGYVSCFEPSRSRSRPGNKLRSENGHRLMELKTIWRKSHSLVFFQMPNDLKNLTRTKK